MDRQLQCLTAGKLFSTFTLNFPCCNLNPSQFTLFVRHYIPVAQTTPPKTDCLTHPCPVLATERFQVTIKSTASSTERFLLTQLQRPQAQPRQRCDGCGIKYVPWPDPTSIQAQPCAPGPSCRMTSWDPCRLDTALARAKPRIFKCYSVESQTQSLTRAVKQLQNSRCVSILLYDQVDPACLDCS